MSHYGRSLLEDNHFDICFVVVFGPSLDLERRFIFDLLFCVFRHLFMCRLHKLGVVHWCDVCVYVAIVMRLLYMSIYVAIVLQFLNFRHDRRWQAHPWQGLIQ